MNIENKIIGQLLLPGNRKIKTEALLTINPDLFESEKNKKLLEVITHLVLAEKEADIVSVYQNMNGEITAEEISGYTKDLTSIADIESNIWLLKAKNYKKNLVFSINKYLLEIKGGSFPEDLEEVKNHLIADLSAIELEDKSEFISISSFKEKIIEHIKTNREIEGYSWGIQDLDAWTGGIVSPMVYVIGGLKKSGKTRFVVHTLMQLHRQQVHSAFLSMEMPGYELTKLLYASLLGLNDIQFRATSKLNITEKGRFERATINELLLGIECKSGLCLDNILSRIKRYAKMGYKVIFIDYLQRIKFNRGNQATELEDITIRIADSARENKISIVLLSQLNATAEYNEPSMGQLKGSGGIGEAADCILLFDNLYRRTKREEDKNRIDFYIEQRYGDSGKLTIQADLGSCRFHGLIRDDKIINYPELQERYEQQEIF